jgi:hypothetical protein
MQAFFWIFSARLFPASICIGTGLWLVSKRLFHLLGVQNYPPRERPNPGWSAIRKLAGSGVLESVWGHDKCASVLALLEGAWEACGTFVTAAHEPLKN